MLALALAAGVLAAVNPCGFALLPAYLSLLVTGDGPAPAIGTAVRRALVLTSAMTAGFVAVFGVFGLVFSQVTGLVQRLPFFTVALGLLLAVLGGWLLAGRQVRAPWRPARAPAVRRSWPSMALFGAAYALASLGCTIGPFLAIVVSSVRSDTPFAGLGLFLAYAVGMGLVVATAALAVALARASLISRVRRATPVLSRLSGLLLVVTGGYVAYHGWYELRALSGGRSADPVIEAGTAVQQALAGALDSVGVASLAGAFGLLLAVAALISRSWSRLPPIAGERDQDLQESDGGSAGEGRSTVSQARGGSMLIDS